jgi:hypothetical protein
MKISRRRKHNKRSKYTKRVKYAKHLKKTYKKTNVRRFIKTHNKRTLRGGIIDIRPSETYYDFGEDSSNVTSRNVYKLVNTERSGDNEDVVTMKYKQLKKRDVIDEGDLVDKIWFSFYKKGKFNVSLRENDNGSYKVTLSLLGTNTSFSFNIKFISKDKMFIIFSIEYKSGYTKPKTGIYRVQYTRGENNVSINIIPDTIHVQSDRTWNRLSDGELLSGIDADQALDDQASPDQASPDQASPDQALDYYGYVFKPNFVIYALIKFIATSHIML